MRRPFSITLALFPCQRGVRNLWAMAETERLNCSWCGVEIPRPSRGRRPRYCGRSCRQRAYEVRSAGVGTMVLDDEALQRLHDGLYQLRCAAEDLRTAVSEGADPSEIGKMAAEIEELAQALDKVR